MNKLSVYMDGSAQRALRQQQVLNRTQRMGVARLREFSGIFGQMGEAFEEMAGTMRSCTGKVVIIGMGKSGHVAN